MLLHFLTSELQGTTVKPPEYNLHISSLIYFRNKIKHITKALFNVRSIPCSSQGGGVVTPPRDDCDMPQMDRSQVRGELSNTLLTFSSQEGRGKGKRWV